MVSNLLLLEFVEVRLAGSRLRLLVELHLLLLLLGHCRTTTITRGTLSDNLHAGAAELAGTHARIVLAIVAASKLCLVAVLQIGPRVTSLIQWRLLGRRLLKSLVR